MIFQRARRAFYGWRILAASSVVGAIGGGLHMYGFSVFFLPVSRSLDLSRAATSLVFSLSRAEGAVEGPAAGYLIDRLGPRKVLFGAAIIMGVGYLLFSRVDSFITFLLVYMGVISLGFNAGLMHVPMALVNSWFIRRRSFALGILMASFALGGALIVPTLSVGIQHFGWQTAALLCGLVVLGTVPPICLILRRSPESMGLLPDGDRDRVEVNQVPAAPAGLVRVDFSVREALRTTSFWVLSGAISLRMGAHMALITHFIPIMVWKGTDEPSGAALLGMLASLSIPCRILLGWAGDRLPKYLTLAVACSTGAAALLFLQYAEPGWHLWAFVALLTVVESMGPLQWALVGDFFGRYRYATIRGIMSAFIATGAMAMPFVAGIIFDNTQSYELVLWLISALLALSAVTFAVLRPPHLPVR